MIRRLTQIHADEYREAVEAGSRRGAKTPGRKLTTKYTKGTKREAQKALFHEAAEKC